MVLLNMVGNQMSSEAVLVQAIDMIRGVGHAPSVNRKFAHYVKVPGKVLVVHLRLSNDLSSMHVVLELCRFYYYFS